MDMEGIGNSFAYFILSFFFYLIQYPTRIWQGKSGLVFESCDRRGRGFVQGGDIVSDFQLKWTSVIKSSDHIPNSLLRWPNT